MIEVRVERDRCIGSGNCVFWAPDSFDLDDAGISVPHLAQGADEGPVLRAVAGCPVGALTAWRDGSPVAT